MVNKYFIGFLTLIVLTASIYIMIPGSVRIDVGKTYSTFKVWENDSWVLSGQEYTILYDKTKKMRANNRVVNYTIEGNKTISYRYAYFKNGCIALDTYIFDGSTDDVELFPVDHKIETFNCNGFILVYEVTKLEYLGETDYEIGFAHEFGHNMKIEWSEGNYYERLYKYKNKNEGKLTIKYRIEDDYLKKHVKLYDPIISEDTVFTRLISNKAGLTSGEAIFEINNPIENLSTNDIFFSNYLAKGLPITSDEFYVSIMKQKNGTKYKDFIIEKTYKELDNKTGLNITKTSNSIVKLKDGFKLVNYTSWEKVDKLPKGKHLIKYKAKWNAHIGEQSIDWFVNINFDKAKYELPKDKFGIMKSKLLKSNKWAWFNSSFLYKRELSNLSGNISFMEINKSGNMQPNFGDVRFVNQVDDSELNYTIEAQLDGSGYAYSAFTQEGLTLISPANMTSNSAPSPFVASSSGVSSGHEPYHGFDGVWASIPTDSWQSDTTSPFFIKIDLGSGNEEAATRLVMQQATGGTSRPEDYTIQGSNDDSGWDILDTITGQPNAAGPYTYDFENSNAYRYYKLVFTDNHGATIYTIDEVEIYSGTFGLKNGLVSYYKLDETTGTNAEDSHGVNNGTNSGATINVTGIINTAYDFESGESDSVDISASTDFNLGGGFGISVWVDTESQVGSNHIFSRWSGTPSFNVRLNAGVPEIQCFDGSVTSTFAGSGAISGTGFQHIVFVYDGGTTGTNAHIYINGLLDNEGTISRVPQVSATDISIGKEGGGSTGYFDGIIDEVAIYNRSLVENEIQNLYNASYAQFRVNNLGEESIDMYYGNPEVGTTESASDVYFNPISAYYFDANANDFVGSNHGTVNGATLVDGAINNSYDFDGSNDYIHISSIDSAGQNWSFSCWVKEDAFTASGWQDFWDHDHSTDRITIALRDKQFIVFDTAQRSSGFTINDLDFHHYVVTQSGTSMKFYVDGNLENTVTSAGNDFGGSDAYFGRFYSSNIENLNGLMDEVLIHDKTLSQDQITKLYTQTAPNFIEGNETSQVETIPPTYSNNQTNNTNAGESTLFSILWDDDTALNTSGQYIFSTNNTGTWVNDSSINFTTTPSWANVTKVLNSTANLVIGYRWYATDNAQNENNTEIFILTTLDATPPSVLINSPISQNYNISEILFSINVTDNVGIDSCWYNLNDGVNVSLIEGTYELCYQESANTTDQVGTDGDCGLLYNGSYINGSTDNLNWDNDFINFNDGNRTYTGFASDSFLAGSGIGPGNYDGSYYVNYTKPQGAVSALTRLSWINNTFSDQNFSIPTSCFSQGNLQFQAYFYGDSSANGLSWLCYNGSSWETIYDQSSAAILIGSVYEEAMWWNIPGTGEPGTYTHTNSSVPNGEYTANYFCNDTSSNLNNTESVDFNVSVIFDTCNPSSPLISNHIFNCSDNCIQSIDLDAGGFNISIIGTGTFKTNVSIFNYNKLHIEGTDSSNICTVTCKEECFS